MAASDAGGRNPPWVHRADTTSSASTFGRWWCRNEDAVAAVAEAARAHGIGVITAADPGDYDTWEDHEDARRVEPDPERLNTFVVTHLNPATRDLISRRLR
ncbi:hypothetical protein ACQPZF_10370 [Actinosynnema sp. CS-041913]|uniref:hypothetical protein n=1 Tax=Actinosynnema sp. CS-041913 TaxID=3239917 RepID=UPI003D921D0F